MKYIIRSLPNAITCLNLLFGCVATVFAFRGWTLFAGYCIFLAAICDFCDGLAARSLKAYSDIGKELDSLADVISFGLAPAAMLHILMNEVLSTRINGDLSTVGWELLTFLPFLVTIFSALRLAKFNIDIRQSESFLGLPTPACALFITSCLIYLSNHSALDVVVKNVYVISVVIVLLSALLVSEIPMFALKIKPQGSLVAFLKKYLVQILFLIASAILIICLGFGGVAAAIALYILMSITIWIINKTK